MQKIVLICSFLFVVFFATPVLATDYSEFLLQHSSKSLMCDQAKCQLLDLNSGPVIIFGWALSTSPTSTAPAAFQNIARLEATDNTGNTSYLTLAHSEGPSVYNWGLPVDLSNVTSSFPSKLYITNSNPGQGRHSDVIIWYLQDGGWQGFGQDARRYMYVNASSTIDTLDTKRDWGTAIVILEFLAVIGLLDFVRRIYMPRKR